MKSSRAATTHRGPEGAACGPVSGWRARMSPVVSVRREGRKTGCYDERGSAGKRRYPAQPRAGATAERTTHGLFETTVPDDVDDGGGRRRGPRPRRGGVERAHGAAGRARQLLAVRAAGAAHGPPRRGRRPGRGCRRPAGSPDAHARGGPVVVHRPPQLGPVGRRRREGRHQPHHRREERGGDPARAVGPEGLGEPRLRAVAAVHPQEPAGGRRGRGVRLLRLHLPRSDGDPHRRPLPHVGERRHVAGAATPTWR